MTAEETIGELFAGPGARDYLGEPVPIGEHMLQAGALAEAAGAEEPAGGRGPAARHRPSARRGRGRGPARRVRRTVAEPVVRRGGDPAGAPARGGERYLCAVDAAYSGRCRPNWFACCPCRAAR